MRSDSIVLGEPLVAASDRGAGTREPIAPAVLRQHRLGPQAPGGPAGIVGVTWPCALVR
jgi:hypothetical protein